MYVFVSMFVSVMSESVYIYACLLVCSFVNVMCLCVCVRYLPVLQQQLGRLQRP